MDSLDLVQLYSEPALDRMTELEFGQNLAPFGLTEHAEELFHLCTTYWHRYIIDAVYDLYAYWYVWLRAVDVRAYPHPPTHSRAGLSCVWSDFITIGLKNVCVGTVPVRYISRVCVYSRITCHIGFITNIGFVLTPEIGDIYRSDQLVRVCLLQGIQRV